MALRDGCRDGRYSLRGRWTRVRGELCHGAPLGGDGRARFGRVPPGSNANGTLCRGGPTGLCTGYLPDRWACRIRHWAAARCDDCGSAWPGDDWLAVCGGAPCDAAHVVDRCTLCRDAQPATHHEEGTATEYGQGQSAGLVHRDHDDYSHRPSIIEERLHCSIHVLLHLLPDRAVPSVGATLADPVVPLSRRWCPRCHCGWRDR